MSSIRLRRWATLILTASLFSAVAALTLAYVSAARWWTEPNNITLRVALYPYVPDRHGLFYALERDFERRNPGVNLELIDESDFTGNYYKGGLQRVDADIYEIDTILLADMISLGKLAPIDLPDRNFLPEALKAVTNRDGKTYGVPHWVCGNFLFYRKSDRSIAEAKTWPELLAAVKQSGKPLLVDLKGSSGLGEWYMTALADRVGMDAAQETIMRDEGLAQDVVAGMSGIAQSCPDGFCRSTDLHDRTGYYARVFMRGQHSAYIGYSEAMYYGFQDALDDCAKGSQCLTEDDVAVRRLPPFGAKPTGGVGWVDALAIDSNLKGKKLEVAKEFVRFAVGSEAYRQTLTPGWMRAPRYLLPARGDQAIEGAKLYPELFAAFSGRSTGSTAGLNDRLRKIGARLDCALPIPADDEETAEACKKAP